MKQTNKKVVSCLSWNQRWQNWKKRKLTRQKKSRTWKINSKQNPVSYKKHKKVLILLMRPKKMKFKNRRRRSKRWPLKIQISKSKLINLKTNIKTLRPNIRNWNMRKNRFRRRAIMLWKKLQRLNLKMKRWREIWKQFKQKLIWPQWCQLLRFLLEHLLLICWR